MKSHDRPTALVLGAGWAGLSCAVELADLGYSVTVLEQSKRIGGRASSFINKQGFSLDNGQHLFMRCYEHTLRFLEKIGSVSKIRFQENCSVTFVNRKSKKFYFRCGTLPTPLHFASGLLGLKFLSWSEKWKMGNVYKALSFLSDHELNHSPLLDSLTAEDWLIQLDQSENARRNFWDLIIYAALNESPKVAGAKALAIVLKQAFLGDRKNSQLGISTEPLSHLCGPTSEKYLQMRGGSILLNQLVTRIEIENSVIKSVHLRDGERLQASVVVSAVPYRHLLQIIDPSIKHLPFLSSLSHLKNSPIVSIVLNFDREIFDDTYVALLDCEIHWVFNRSRYHADAKPGELMLVISGAHSFTKKSDVEILEIALQELRDCFPSAINAKLLYSLVVREKNATLSPQIAVDHYRPAAATPIKNFFLAGDWTKTGLPATIESAVKSGVLAAQAVACAQSSGNQ